nr:MAG TPA: hypothetical protein [Caudoviricetes sp.]
MKTKNKILTGIKEVINNRGYITHMLTNERGRIFGVESCTINKWYAEGKFFYWSEVYVEPNYMFKIIRRGTLLCNVSDSILSEYHEQSKINAGITEL